MNSSINALNAFAPWLLKSWVWPMFWQSSLLIALVFGIELALRRKLRASVRYALWLVVLVKLLLPPSLALPTALSWWVLPSTPLSAATRVSAPVVVTYGPAMAHLSSTAPIAPLPTSPAPANVSPVVWAILVWTGAGCGLLALMLFRWRQVARRAHRSSPAQISLTECVDEARRSIGLRRLVRIRLISGSTSPAVCGLFRPVILLPHSLVSRLAPAQLRAVLLHELIHLRRGDVWVNCAQALLQIVYWWHPLLWLANARIRRVREEAVDDAVMLALRDDAETYAGTLLEVAKLAFRPPFTALGLVGILESRTSLRQRIERLIDFHPPRKAGLTLVSALSVVAFAAAAVPMGQAPVPAEKPKSETIEALTKGPAIGHVSGPVSEVQRTNINARVEDARRLFEMGTIKKAKQILLQVVKEDPRNQEAYYYLNLISEAEIRASLRRSNVGPPTWDDMYRDPNLVYTNRARRAIHSKLDKIRLAEVKFDDMALSQVIANLSEQAKRRDPEKKGINFILNRGPEKADQTAAESVDIARVSIRIVPSLTDVRLSDVLDAIVKVADKPIKYSVEDDGVVFWLKVPEPPPLYTRIFKVDTKKFLAALRDCTGLLPNNTPLPSLGQSPGLSPTNGHSDPDLFVKWFKSLGVDITPPKTFFFNDREGALLARATLQDLDVIQSAIHALNVSAPPVNVKARSVQPPDAAFNLSGTPSAPQLLHSRGGRQTILSKLDRIRLDEVKSDGLPLSEVIAKLSEQAKRQDPEDAGINFILNQGPENVAGTAAEWANVGKVSIRIKPPLKHVRLIDVMDAIVKTADKPITYRVEDYGIVFSLTANEPPPLYFRKIKVNPNVFLDWWQKQPFSPTNASDQQMAINFFATAGLSLPPKRLFFDPSHGTLLVRATLEELDRVEKVLAATAPTPMINIKVKLIELPDTDATAFWQPRAVRNIGGSSPRTAILTDPEARRQLVQWTSRPGVDILNEASITTLSGRQTEIQWANSDAPPGVETNAAPPGPTLDIMAYLSADGFTVQLTTIASGLDRFALDGPGQFVPRAEGDWEAGAPITARVPDTHSRPKALMPASGVLWDGQTFVIGGLRTAARHESKSVLVLISPAVIDPAGNRVHSEDQMPFSQQAIPNQNASSVQPK